MEAGKASSAALTHRQRVIRKSAQTTGLGPLDLVWCRKRASGSFAEQQKDFFHHVFGYDVTSTASAAAYFADLCTRTEKVPRRNT